MDSLSSFLLAAPVLLLSMVAHEYAHGYAALKQGDPTAYQLGRLTWNPAKHIDPFMTILMPVLTWFGSGGTMMFGGAKPVPVDPRHYKHYRRGDIIVSLAGVATNLVLAAICTVLMIPLGLLGRAAPDAAESFAIVQAMLIRGVLFNLILVAFNLLPIPPLDGSHVVKHLLPPALALQYERIGRFGLLILMLFLTVGRPLLAAWMGPAYEVFQLSLRTVAPYLIPSQWLQWT